jgi:hypothetical protein
MATIIFSNVSNDNSDANGLPLLFAVRTVGFLNQEVFEVTYYKKARKKNREKEKKKENEKEKTKTYTKHEGGRGMIYIPFSSLKTERKWRNNVTGKPTRLEWICGMGVGGKPRVITK